MLKQRFKWWRIVTPIILVCSLLLAIVPSAMAATPGRVASPSSPSGSKEYYLALGDSLAFGFQPDLDFRHGYVDDLSKWLVAHDDEFQPVANMAYTRPFAAIKSLKTFSAMHSKMRYWHDWRSVETCE